MISDVPRTNASAESLRIMEYSFDQPGIENLKAWGKMMLMMALMSLIPNALAA
jgi:hypothetical protein